MERIDRLEALDLPNLKAENLDLQFWTGQAQSKGYGIHKISSYRTGVMTPIRDIEISVWIKAAEYIVERDGLQNEVEHLTPFITLPGDNISAHSRQTLRTCILNACLSRLYCNIKWVHFIEYNEKYHPELLALWDNRDQGEEKG